MSKRNVFVTTSRCRQISSGQKSLTQLRRCRHAALRQTTQLQTMAVCLSSTTLNGSWPRLDPPVALDSDRPDQSETCAIGPVGRRSTAALGGNNSVLRMRCPSIERRLASVEDRLPVFHESGVPSAQGRLYFATSLRQPTAYSAECCVCVKAVPS